MGNPKTTLSGVTTALATLVALLAQVLPAKYRQVVTMVAVAIGGAATALGNIQSQDGSP